MTADVRPPGQEQVIGILGGSGPQGRGLAFRFAAAGLPVVIGSRKADRAEEAAAEIARAAGSSRVTGASNEDCARRSGIVLVVVPFEGHADLLTSLGEALAGKVVVDCVNPLGFDKQGPYPLMVAEGSAAEQARELLPDSTVTAAFHHLSAVLLADPEVASIDSDVLVLGDDRSATDAVQALAGTIPGVRGVYGGRLRNAAQVEALTANLIAVNRRYKCHAGLRITDLPG
ncbi:NADPH-dependent F420 reductase [Streptomyces sp. SID4956]|uniref:NADPH-dependent F420 reductase n=1 Tax=Streptomyces sp. SID4956 TaxID=2690290 RepID=UPI00136EA5DC|nr:NADPH-dependent F420 reductase [Streptomyces sp. SID4956]